MTTPIPLSDFDANLVGFGTPKKLDQGGVIGITYDGEIGALRIKIPAGRIPFDCSKGYQDKGSKLELKIELPDTPEFAVARRVLAEIDKAARNHLRDAASDICSTIAMKGAKEKELRAGANFHGLLRAATNAKYPDSLTLKWTAPDPAKAPSTRDVVIVDTQNRPVRWETIKRDAMVTAVVRIKGVFVNTSLTSIQVEPIAMCVVSAKKEVATVELFADEMEAHAAKRQRVAGPPEDESEEADDGA